jgi:hypothetical protein
MIRYIHSRLRSQNGVKRLAILYPQSTGKWSDTVRLRYGYNMVRISAPDNTVSYRPKTHHTYTEYRRK